MAAWELKFILKLVTRLYLSGYIREQGFQNSCLPYLALIPGWQSIVLGFSPWAPFGLRKAFPLSFLPLSTLSDLFLPRALWLLLLPNVPVPSPVPLPPAILPGLPPTPCPFPLNSEYKYRMCDFLPGTMSYYIICHRATPSTNLRKCQKLALSVMACSLQPLFVCELLTQFPPPFFASYSFRASYSRSFLFCLPCPSSPLYSRVQCSYFPVLSSPIVKTNIQNTLCAILPWRTIFL